MTPTNDSSDSIPSLPERASKPPERVRVRYQGRVQGVGFRAQVLNIAKNSPVEGFIRNRIDGSVELVCSGQ
ncbi:MAG: acylphosphatase, partial [Planctomycetota bacterium]